MENIVLVGMPGSGKTSVGRALAERMDRRFVDLDEEFVRRAGMSIPDYFQAHGVDSFREEESKLAAEFGKEGSLVIATGGGVVLRHDNMRALRQNGEVFYVQRPLDALDRQGRPLSTDQQALTAMYEERLPLYLANSAMTIDNSGTVEQAANAIEEGFYALTHHQRP
jgi:shikimate dehydrogenase